jgi:mannitol/fructose-specific phosphotransferase system IIA component (Ntr-type)
MPLSGLLDENRVQVGLRAKTKAEAIKAVAKLFAKGHGLDADRAFAVLMDREGIAVTGIGEGLAVPHGKMDGVKKPAYVLAVAADGIEWDAADGKPVRFLAAVLAPERSAADPVKLLARLARTFRDAGFRERLAGAKNVAQALEVVKAGEKM